MIDDDEIESRASRGQWTVLAPQRESSCYVLPHRLVKINKLEYGGGRKRTTHHRG